MESADVERELRGLAERVRAIEDRLGIAGDAPELQLALPIDHRPAGWQPTLQHLGLAVVGLGVAYILRALVESGTLPAGPGVAIGITYAIAWLVAAAQTAEPAYAATSALVLAPLLWEAVARFHVVTPWSAAGVLFAFALLGMAISWRKDLLSVASIATVTALGTAAALVISTRDVVPFATLFLAIAAAVEVSACLEHWLSERWLAAASADVAVLFATWLVTNARGLPEGYAAIPHGWVIGAQVGLLALYLASTILRTLVRHFTVTGFEMTQCAAAFALAMWGGLPLASVMLGAGAACYVVSFVVLERGGGRNFYAYSTFGLLLVLAASRAMLAGVAAAAVLAVLAIACCWSRRVTLQVHGAVYLALALTLTAPAAAVVAAGLCYAGASRGPLRIPMFAAAVWTIAELAGSVAPANLRLAAKILVVGGALLVLPRVKASPAGGSADSGTTPRPRDSAEKADTASAAG